MAPDHIYEIALLDISHWQRQALAKMEGKMWRKDVQDTIDSCKEAETPFDLYLMGYEEPHYPLPCVALEVVDNGNWMYIRKKRYKKLVAVFYLE